MSRKWRFFIIKQKAQIIKTLRGSELYNIIRDIISSYQKGLATTQNGLYCIPIWPIRECKTALIARFLRKNMSVEAHKSSCNHSISRKTKHIFFRIKHTKLSSRPLLLGCREIVIFNTHTLKGALTEKQRKTIPKPSTPNLLRLKSTSPAHFTLFKPITAK